ncbi:hypothetical protein KAU39_04325 [bacterium]|nr:hypothetical protein [bacterium]
MMIDKLLRCFIVKILMISFLCAGFCNGIEKKSSIDKEKLKKRVELFLKKDNVTRRRNVEDVFVLAEIYEKEGNDKDAMFLYQEGLRVNSWRLDYQLKLAQLMYKYGDKKQAVEKVKIVCQYTEDEELLIKAEEFLSNMGIQPVKSINKTKGKLIENPEMIIVPIGKVNKRLLLEVKDKLQEKMGISYSIMEKEINPGKFDRSYLDKYTIDTKRKLLVSFLRLIPEQNERFKELENQGQFNASRLISELKEKYIIEEGSKLEGYLGITREDIFSGNSNFLFGWAEKNYGVMSYHRFLAEFNREPPNRTRLCNRMVKQGISSSFFILGIPRCTNPTCIRAYPHNLTEHDQKSNELCSWCKEQLKLYTGD